MFNNIFLYYGDMEYLHFTYRYLKKTFIETKINYKIIYEKQIELNELINKSNNLFYSSEAYSDYFYFCNTIPKILNSKINFNIHIFLTGNGNIKNTKTYKSLNKHNIYEFKQVINEYGIPDKANINNIINKIHSFENYKIIDKNTLEYLILNTKFGGIFNDLDNIINLISTFKNINFNEILDLTIISKKDIIFNIINYIQNFNEENIFEYLYDPQNKYISILMLLQTIYYNLYRYSIIKDLIGENLDRIKEHYPDLNKNSIIRYMKYMNRIGDNRIKEIYEQINYKIAQETVSESIQNDHLKLSQLGLLILGKETCI